MPAPSARCQGTAQRGSHIPQDPLQPSPAQAGSEVRGGAHAMHCKARHAAAHSKWPPTEQARQLQPHTRRPQSRQCAPPSTPCACAATPPTHTTRTCATLSSLHSAEPLDPKSLLAVHSAGGEQWSEPLEPKPLLRVHPSCCAASAVGFGALHSRTPVPALVSPGALARDRLQHFLNARPLQMAREFIDYIISHSRATARVTAVLTLSLEPWDTLVPSLQPPEFMAVEKACIGIEWGGPTHPGGRAR